MKQQKPVRIIKKKNTGRNYVKKQPVSRTCAICSTPFASTHPKQKTCLKRECTEALQQRNYDAFIERENKKLQERRALAAANKVIEEYHLKEAQRIIEQFEKKVASGK